MTIVDNFDFRQNLRFVIPCFMYGLSLLVTIVARFDLGHFFLREVPRIGSELCKIACALMLGAMALGLKSEPLKDSALGKRQDSDLAAALLLVFFTALFFLSYKCFCAVEGRAIWREQRKVGRWISYVMGWTAAQGFGVYALLVAVSNLQGGRR
jgi:hypothetical protein